MVSGYLKIFNQKGIIHPCVHPTDKPAPRNEEEMFEAIFKYLDKILSIVRPREIIYMALDGGFFFFLNYKY